MTGLDRDKWNITKHAAGRALDMQISMDDIVMLLEWPTASRNSASYEGHRTFSRGDITAAVDTRVTPHIVKTFLWSTQEGWDRDFAKTAQYLDREKREDAFGASTKCPPRQSTSPTKSARPKH